MPYFSTIAETGLGLEAGVDAEHRRHVRAGDVRVQQADLRAVLPERQREVHGDRGLADAALVRGDGDDVAHALDRLGTAADPR